MVISSIEGVDTDILKRKKLKERIKFPNGNFGVSIWKPECPGCEGHASGDDLKCKLPGEMIQRDLHQCFQCFDHIVPLQSTGLKGGRFQSGIQVTFQRSDGQQGNALIGEVPLVILQDQR